LWKPDDTDGGVNSVDGCGLKLVEDGGGVKPVEAGGGVKPVETGSGGVNPGT